MLAAAALVASPVFAVIPAGGAGSRLWPWSTQAMPKHLLDLDGSGRTLLQQTHDRVSKVTDEVFVLTEARQEDAIRAQLPNLDHAHVIVEPTARGTANALGLAAMTLAERDPSALMVSLPADHIIQGVPAYNAALRRAIRIAEASDHLVTIGLKPTRPATGYGYIRAGKPVRHGRDDAFTVAQFVEKPSADRAEKYVEAGDYFWNLAMFSWRATAFLEELERVAPEHHDGLRSAVSARRAGREAQAARIYSDLPNEAVDYAVMERTNRLLLVPATFGWLDVGSWSELHEILLKDANGNAIDGDSVLIESSGNLFSAPGKVVAAIGIRDLIVIDTPHALLVLPRSRAQDVKMVVDQLRRARKSKYL